MVTTRAVLETLGDSSEVRTRMRFLTEQGAIPKGKGGRDGAGAASLAPGHVAICVLGMASPEAQSVAQYARELAGLIGQNGLTLADTLADAFEKMCKTEKSVIADLWLPNHSGGHRYARATICDDEDQFEEHVFLDVRRPEEIGATNIKTNIKKTGITWVYELHERRPAMARWLQVEADLLYRLAMLFKNEYAKAKDNAA